MYIQYEDIQHPATFGDLRSIIQANDTPFAPEPELLKDPAAWAYYGAYIAQQPKPVATCPLRECLFPCFVRGQAVVYVPEARHVVYHVLGEVLERFPHYYYADEVRFVREVLIGNQRRAGGLTGWRGALISSLMWSVENPGETRTHLRRHHSEAAARGLAACIWNPDHSRNRRRLEEMGQGMILDFLTEVGPFEIRRRFEKAYYEANLPRILAP